MRFQKSKVTIIISDHSAVIVHHLKCKLLSQWVILANDDDAIFALKSYIIEYKQCVVHIILNCSGQEYRHHYLNIPFTSSEGSFLTSLVNEERLKKGAFADLILLNKADCHYLSVTQAISLSWVGFAESLSSEFQGFSLASLEYKQVINVLSLGLDFPVTNGRVDVLLMINQGSQVQIVIYRDGAFCDSRSVSLEVNSNVTVSTGYIKQSFDTVVSSLNVASDCIVTGYFVVPDEVKSKLLLHVFKQKNIVIVSVYEALIMLDLDWAIGRGEHSHDMLSAYNVVNNGKADYLFNTNHSKKKKESVALNHALDTALGFLMMCYVMFSIYVSSAIYSQYILRTELMQESMIATNAIEGALESYDAVKNISMHNLESIISIADSKNDNNDALQYLFSMNQSYDNKIVGVRYDNQGEASDTSTTKVRIKADEQILYLEKD